METKPNILLVDDKPENLIALEVVLRSLNANFVKATNGNDALRETLHHDFALALLDIQMPEMDGYELASILREEEKTSQLPFIFISAVYTDSLHVFKGYERGAFSFITKPFEPDLLINKVMFFIEKYQQELALKKLYYSLEHKNKELQNMNRELESFSYSVSHDLRAPLRALNGYVQMLHEDYGKQLDKEGRQLIDLIANNSVKMGILINELLEFSRLGRKKLNNTAINMNKLIEEVVTELNNSTEHHAVIKIGKLPEIQGDCILIRQVISNLLSNAIKYSSKKKEPIIEIFAKENNDEVIFTFEDNGVGFNMEYAHKLFGVFQRLHSQKEFSGTGVGLALVERIITKHGGKVWAEGKVNEGAVFNFSLSKIRNRIKQTTKQLNN